jgi:hypothetical protein
VTSPPHPFRYIINGVQQGGGRPNDLKSNIQV